MSPLATTTPVGLVGSGAMGQGIAQVAAQAGHPVRLFDAAEGAAAQAKTNIEKVMARLVEKGRVSEADAAATLERLQPVTNLEDLAGCGLVVEAIVEDLGIKQKVFAQLEDICGPDAVLATNTSSLSITAIGAGLAKPERLLGMHFFNPAPLMKLVEVVSGLATDQALADAIFATAEAWGKTAVHCTSTPGFIVNRVARPYYAEGLRLLEEQAADAATLDALYREAGGFKMGPFELMDLIGHDVNYAVTESVWRAFYSDPRFLPSLKQKELVEAGRLGRKSGRGFFDYSEGATKPEPTTMEGPRPKQVTVHGDLGPASGLVELAEKAGLKLQEAEPMPGLPGYITVDGVVLALTDGATATELTAFELAGLNHDHDEDSDHDHNHGPLDVVLFDLALDYGKASRIALSASLTASAKALPAAAGFFAALGLTPTPVADVPGLVVARTVAMLANEGASAVQNGVCSPQAVNAAMQGGVNYPKGPLAWADALGLDYVAALLGNLAEVYGEDRYRVNPLLRQKLAAGQLFG